MGLFMILSFIKQCMLDDKNHWYTLLFLGK